MRLVTVLAFMLFSFFTATNGFLDRQLNNPRVKIAYAKKESIIRYMLSEKQIDKSYFDVYLKKNNHLKYGQKTLSTILTG
jgi:hypothetical protein